MDPTDPLRLSALPMFAEPTPRDDPPAQTPPAARQQPQVRATAPEPAPASPLGRLASQGVISRLLPPRDRPTTGPADDRPEQPPGSTSTDRAGPPLRWRRRYAPGGEPAEIQEFLGYLILGLIAAAGLTLRSRHKTLRTPDRQQLDAMSRPLARVACRHLPMHLLGPDVLDLTKAARATSDYATAGPLVIPRVVAGDAHQPAQEE